MKKFLSFVCVSLVVALMLFACTEASAFCGNKCITPACAPVAESCVPACTPCVPCVPCPAKVAIVKFDSCRENIVKHRMARDARRLERIRALHTKCIRVPEPCVPVYVAPACVPVRPIPVEPACEPVQPIPVEPACAPVINL